MSTLGPWAVSPTKHRTLIVSAQGFHVTALEEVSPDDAALMAAAPALLAALQKTRAMVWHMTGDDAACAPWNELLPHIDAAIANATGD
mgnify:CR=1 FL=1